MAGSHTAPLGDSSVNEKPIAVRFRGFDMWKRAIGPFGRLLLEQSDGMIYATAPESDDRIVGNYAIEKRFGYAWPAIKWSRRYRKFKDVSNKEFE